MGMRMCGLFIKKENLTVDLVKELIVPIYGSPDDVLSNATSKDLQNLNKWLSINFYSNGIILWDQELTLDILTKQDTEKIELIYNSFEKPAEIIAFMHFDSGDSFGFSYIRDGEIHRYRYSLSNEIGDREFGDPLPEEKVITEAEVVVLKDEDEVYYRLDNREHACSFHFICSELANEVMQHRIGFNMYDDELWRNSKLFVWSTQKLISEKI